MANDDKMSLQERDKYLRKMQKRYRKANHRAKNKLLDEMEAVTELHRKSLTRLMGSTIRRKPRQGRRGPTYGPQAEDDRDGWQTLTAQLPDLVLVVGDDLFATNAARLQRGIDARAANAILVKMNQVGTLSETLAVIEMAKQAGFRPIISARSGETEDVLMADLAIATNVGLIKIGSLAQSERLAKYNQLLRNEEMLGKQAEFYGRKILEPVSPNQGV